MFHHRRCAIELLEQGLSESEVEADRRVGVNRRSMRRWHSAPAKLMPQQQDELAQALLQGAKAAGFDRELWTGAGVSRP